MENASKALLIAGAILIVILLIAVGMMVYNGAKGSIDKGISSMSSTEKDIHNKQFEAYIGNNVSGSNLRTLYSKIISNNGEEGNVKVKAPQISSTGIASKADDTEAKLSASLPNIKTSASASYRVEAVYSNGVITEIKVSQNS